jgi:starch synthase
LVVRYDINVTTPLKILFIAAEASPLAKVGGLGDVIGSLPKELRRIGHDARVVLPFYGTIRTDSPILWHDSYTVDFLGVPERVEISEILLKGEVPLYLLHNPTYFDRTAVYGEKDDGERFQFFSRAAMELPRRLDWHPDILHCHDWHTALCAGLLVKDYLHDRYWTGTGSVFTIHNLAYQGWIDDAFIWKTGLHKYLLPQEDPLRHSTYSKMGIGIAWSDIVTTVSETYAGEILTPEYGFGMENLLQRRKNSLYGILNGIDYEEFNPATDARIVAHYDTVNPGDKLKSKVALQKLVNLPVEPKTPLVGMAGRLVHQKGPDIVADALEPLLHDTEVQFILQGTGETQYQELLEKLESLHIRKARVFFVLDFTLADMIYAGADMFLQPSRYEPCGLAPMIAMRYGTVPVVRHTGGMVETVPDCSADLKTGRGFVFEKYDAGELMRAIKRGITSYRDKEAWLALMRRDMETDFSWKPAIPKYETVYELARQAGQARLRRP